MNKHGWLRFSLRTFLVLVAVSAFCMGPYLMRLRARQAAVDRVRELGGWILYEYQFDPRSGNNYRGTKRYEVKPYGPRLLHALFGADAFNSPYSINLAATPVTDADLAILKDMPELRSIGLEQTEVSDAGLMHLAELGHLKTLYLHSTRVTDRGVRDLIKASPDIDVHYRVEPVKVDSRVLSQIIYHGAETTRLGVQTKHRIVTEVLSGSPASLCDLEIGDRVLEVDGVEVADGNSNKVLFPVAGESSLTTLIDSKPLGARVRILVERMDHRITLIAALDGTGH